MMKKLGLPTDEAVWAKVIPDIIQNQKDVDDMTILGQLDEQFPNLTVDQQRAIVKACKDHHWGYPSTQASISINVCANVLKYGTKRLVAKHKNQWELKYEGILGHKGLPVYEDAFEYENMLNFFRKREYNPSPLLVSKILTILKCAHTYKEYECCGMNIAIIKMMDLNQPMIGDELLRSLLSMNLIASLPETERIQLRDDIMALVRQRI
jgi:hypothetical protein